jgi:hypothetical protein
MAKTNLTAQSIFSPIAAVAHTVGEDHDDVYEGSSQALIAAGLIQSADQLVAQGRCRASYLLPNGERVQRGALGSHRASAGFREVSLVAPDFYRVRLTVSAEEQAKRRIAGRVKREAKSAEYEAAQPLDHRFTDTEERWVGTREQLRAVGIGVGIDFPGDNGTSPRKNVETTDAEGFSVSIRAGSMMSGERPGPTHRFYVSSPYLPEDGKQARSRYRSDLAGEVAPGVSLETICHSNFYRGTAEALVAAGLLRRDQFPGQEGRAKHRACYYADGAPVTGLVSMGRLPAGCYAVTKCGTKNFELQLLVDKDEQKRREQKECDALLAERNRNAQARLDRIAVRRSLEEGGAPDSVESFRTKRMGRVEAVLATVWAELFCGSEGAYSFDVDEESDSFEDLTEAFELIRQAVETAPVRIDRSLLAARATARKAREARNDPAFAVFMCSATKKAA